MRDLIDLGNLVFNQLIKAHNEIEESRLMFLYQITKGEVWYVMGSTRTYHKTVLITKDGITKNFPDNVIDSLHKEWLALKLEVDTKFLEARIKAMRDEFDRKAPKDGEIWEFGKAGSPFRELKF